jgi:hypothetical protein
MLWLWYEKIWFVARRDQRHAVPPGPGSTVLHVLQRSAALFCSGSPHRFRRDRFLRDRFRRRRLRLRRYC